MKKLFWIFVLGFYSCGTTNTAVVSESANLSKYNFATISNVMDYKGSAALMEIEVKIYDALSNTRLTVIGDKELDSLSDVQKSELLLVRYSASQSSAESVVGINFVDYLTGRPVASCRGAYAMGWNEEHDMRVAIDNALIQMKILF
jgi:hypothetical protein